MLYELATLTIRIGSLPQVNAGIDGFVRDGAAKGTLLGCFATDIGALNQVFVLRSFEAAADVQAERLRVYTSANPFNCGDALTAMSLETYLPFPFVPPVKPGRFGGVYEFRQYTVKTGGLPQTAALWEKALPARLELSPLLVAMYALDGAPRYAHIWPYADVATRGKIRADAMAKGVWPPVGGAQWLADMRSTITVPTAISPLQ
jgi:NIPSNAP